MNTEELSLLKNELKIDFLESTFIEHRLAAQELALNELCSMEPIFSGCSTIASLSKTDFNNLMKRIKRKYAKTNEYIVLVAVVTDTLTCMIKNNSFYLAFAGDNKYTIDVMLELLRSVLIIIRSTTDSESTLHLLSLIAILERSAARIKDCRRYEDILEIISEFKVITQNKENINTNNKCKLDISQQPLQPQQLHLNNNTTLKCLNNIQKLEMKQPVVNADEPAATRLDYTTLQATVRTIPVKEDVNKPKNAFEFMMMSSKILSAKRKSTP